MRPHTGRRGNSQKTTYCILNMAEAWKLQSWSVDSVLTITSVVQPLNTWFLLFWVAYSCENVLNFCCIFCKLIVNYFFFLEHMFTTLFFTWSLMLWEIAFHFILYLFIMTLTIVAVFEVIVPELLWVQVFWHVTLWCWERGVTACQRTVLPSKCRQPLAQWRRITSRKTWTLSNYQNMVLI